MRNKLRLVMCVGVLMGMVVAAGEPGRESFNQQWQFARYGLMPNGSTNAEPALDKLIAPGVDDSSCQTLDVPHDWAISGPFRYDLPGYSGKLPWRGIGWYRKHFDIAVGDEGKHVFVDFDGAMANAKVWCNGHYVGEWPFPYQGFRLELTPYLKWGKGNVLAVRLDTMRWGSRWYPGAGLYRNVWLVKKAPVHVGQWGVCVTTPAMTEAKLVVTLDNQTDKPADVEVRADIAGAECSVKTTVAANGSNKAELTVTVPNAKPWDLASPNLYTARVSVVMGGKVVDTYDQSFGFRTIQFTARDGFHLNGRRVQIQGTCNHHDLGALGAAVNTRALERQLQILKEMGCNALRTAHNPPAPELLELADRMGFVVMCEAFDCWAIGKTTDDYGRRLFKDWHRKDLQAMVRHFRNHPSVVIWSTGNEVAEQNDGKLAKVLTDIIHGEDPTRPVTVGCNNSRASVNGFQTGVDVFGLNYSQGFYKRALDYPGNETKPFVATESSSCVSSRGEYDFFGTPTRSGFQVSSYDNDHPSWGSRPDEEFRALEQNPAFAGEFVWTGFDYLGEPTPFNNDITNLLNIRDKDPVKIAAMKKDLEQIGRVRCPSRSSYFGIVDLAGFRKDRYYLYQSQWRPELPMAHLMPHWTWPERVGQITPVQVYTSGDEAELFLNGKSLGRIIKQRESRYRLRWDDVKYEPGTLRVVAYKGGKEWSTDTVKTTGSASKIALEADRARITADGKDLSFITVRIADQDGLIVPRASNLVTFSVDGPGEIVAVDNGNPISFEPFQASQRKAFNGLCLVIIRAKPGLPGAITVKAESEGLATAAINLESVRWH